MSRVVGICVRGGCAGARGLQGSLPVVRRVGIEAMLRSQSQTSGCSLGRLYSSRDTDRNRHHCICSNDNVSRAGYSLWRIDCRKPPGCWHCGGQRQRPGCYPGLQAQGRNLPQRKASQQDRKYQVQEATSLKWACCGCWCCLDV